MTLTADQIEYLAKRGTFYIEYEQKGVISSAYRGTFGNPVVLGIEGLEDLNSMIRKRNSFPLTVFRCDISNSANAIWKVIGIDDLYALKDAWINQWGSISYNLITYGTTLGTAFRLQ